METNDFILTNDNYYSSEANNRYMSVHQYLDFVGGMAIKGCEERALATLKGEYREDNKSTALLVGSYVDSYFEGTLDTFKKENADIFTQKGELKAPYKQAEKMIERCERDKFFMQTMSGEKQVIMTAYIFGCDWKIKIDSYLKDKAIVDLKTSADIYKVFYVEDYGRASFIEAFNYLTQMAVYQKVVEINTGKKLPCYISVVSKSDNPDIEVIFIDQESLDTALKVVEENMPSVLAIKNGEAKPRRCGKCEYCKATKIIKKPINYQNLISELE